MLLTCSNECRRHAQVVTAFIVHVAYSTLAVRAGAADDQRQQRHTRYIAQRVSYWARLFTRHAGEAMLSMSADTKFACSARHSPVGHVLPAQAEGAARQPLQVCACHTHAENGAMLMRHASYAALACNDSKPHKHCCHPIQRCCWRFCIAGRMPCGACRTLLHARRIMDDEQFA